MVFELFIQMLVVYLL